MCIHLGFCFLKRKGRLTGKPTRTPAALIHSETPRGLSPRLHPKHGDPALEISALGSPGEMQGLLLAKTQGLRLRQSQWELAIWDRAHTHTHKHLPQSSNCNAQTPLLRNSCSRHLKMPTRHAVAPKDHPQSSMRKYSPYGASWEQHCITSTTSKHQMRRRTEGRFGH